MGKTKKAARDAAKTISAIITEMARIDLKIEELTRRRAALRAEMGAEDLAATAAGVSCAESFDAFMAHILPFDPSKNAAATLRAALKSKAKAAEKN